MINRLGTSVGLSAFSFVRMTGFLKCSRLSVIVVLPLPWS
jgi:hypothetical protein